MDRAPPRPRRVFRQPANLLRPAFWNMLGEVAALQPSSPRRCRAMMSAGGLAALDDSVGDFLAEHRFSKAFRDWYLLPLLACIWSCKRPSRCCACQPRLRWRASATTTACWQRTCAGRADVRCATAADCLRVEPHPRQAARRRTPERSAVRTRRAAARLSAAPTSRPTPAPSASTPSVFACQRAPGRSPSSPIRAPTMIEKLGAIHYQRKSVRHWSSHTLRRRAMLPLQAPRPGRPGTTSVACRDADDDAGERSCVGIVLVPIGCRPLPFDRAGNRLASIRSRSPQRRHRCRASSTTRTRCIDLPRARGPGAPARALQGRADT